MLEGAVDILRVTLFGEELIRTERRGEFVGELDVLAGRQSLVSARVREDGAVLEISREGLRRIVVGDAELSDVLMRAFLLRRTFGIARRLGDAVLVGSGHSAATLQLREFLTRNGQPYTYVDVESAPDVQQLLERFRVRVEDVPVVLCGRGTVLRNPSKRQVAECLGFSPSLDETRVHDTVVVGAGPSGLAAAVYAASEGLDIVVVEAEAPGGQAANSSKIENYLGFPTGISGQDLASFAYAQAEKFGADVSIARTAQRLDCDRTPYEVLLDGGGRLLARSVILAHGARYRRPAVADSRFEGTGIYYAATPIEAQLCRREQVVVVGGGNSAGQAAVFLTGVVDHAHMLVRSGGLKDTMSAYLVQRIRQNPKITVHTHTELDLLEGDRHLERVRWRNNLTGESETHRVRHVFVMTGADPNTAWLRGCVALDDKGFIKTGQDLAPGDLAAWTAASRHPYMLETSIRGVFAVGDVRSASVKRVASAVGEGAICVQLLHKVLAE